MNKIEQFGLQSRVLELAGLGRTTAEIAEAVSAELLGRGIGCKLHQTTVSRWLKRTREDRAAETRAVVQEHIKEVVPKDLEALEEIESWLLGIFRNQRELVKLRAGHLEDPAVRALLDQVNGGGETFDTKTRANAAMMALKVVELKLKYSGILEPEGSAGKKSSAEEIDEELGDELERAISEVGTRKGEAGIPAHH